MVLGPSPFLPELRDPTLAARFGSAPGAQGRSATTASTGKPHRVPCTT